MSLTYRLWLAFVLMAILSLTSALIGWAGFRHIKQIEQQSTINLLPTMDAARQLSESGAHILFSAQALNEVTSETELEAQGKILTTQSIRIRQLLESLQQLGFDTTDIGRQEQKLADNLSLQGTLVQQKLERERQISQINERIASAANQISELTKSQVNNARTEVSANIASLYDNLERQDKTRVEQALDRLVEVDLDRQSRMTELHEQSLTVAYLLSQIANTNAEKTLADIEPRFRQLVDIVKRRLQFVADPHRRSNLRLLASDLALYQELFQLKRHSLELKKQLDNSNQYNLLLFSQFNGQLNALVHLVSSRNQQALRQVSSARETNQNLLIVMSIVSLITLLLILWHIVWRSVARPLTIQTEALKRILNGDLQTPLPQTISASELKTIGHLVEQFRTNTVSLHHQQRHLETLVDQRTQELSQLVEQHTLARKEAEVANRAKSTFLAMMSHEIRTPLNAILGTTQILLLKPQSPENTSAINTIHDSGENLLSILNDILDYSSIESGNIAICPSPVAPAQLIQQAGQLMSGAAQKKGLDLRLEMAAGLPEYVKADQQRVWQIVCNLLGNAIKFTDRGTITLSSYGDAERWNISVKDTGIGIPSESQKALFQPFTQLTHRRGGTGLGLTICQRLAEAMQAQLYFESRPGEGSCFTLSIPVTEVSAPLALSPANSGSVVSYAGMQVLLVEDNLLNQKITAELLSQLGCSVTPAINGAEALAKVAQSALTFDMALVDLDLPDMDGFTLANALHQRCPDLPLTAFSAHIQSEVIERCHQSGFIGFISKPLRLRDLTDYLSHHRPVMTLSQPEDNNLLDKQQFSEDIACFGREKLAQWLQLYRQQNLPLIEQLKDNLASQDTEASGRLAHQLKSSSQSLAMSALSLCFGDIEQGKWVDIDYLERLVADSLSALEKALAE
ncbi:TMAO reductase system sensor histidine kinase/response regulator TorS [Pragia fontium]|uniref:TMAO reductase system sensor histidine kinase/response regulator TorS n=1 Tax=Pragia fontium TaxID=82985 RepID=UPI000F70B9ED|nr:TMAO reductase system sensor histidine kinase/response regulator TorS [Pragia fontium]VEJ56488.1 Sensor protein torS [Pragia fontium]